jgi:hypothetical protein
MLDPFHIVTARFGHCNSLSKHLFTLCLVEKDLVQTCDTILTFLFSYLVTKAAAVALLRLCPAACASTLACSILASTPVAGPTTTGIQIRISRGGECGIPISHVFFPVRIFPWVPHARVNTASASALLLPMRTQVARHSLTTRTVFYHHIMIKRQRLKLTGLLIALAVVSLFGCSNLCAF